MGFLARGELMVVETERDRFFGAVEVQADVLVVRTGLRGRPALVPHDAVLRIVPASEWQLDLLDSERAEAG